MSDSPQATGEPGVELDDTDATTIVVVGLVSTVLVLCSALGVGAIYEYTANSIVAGREAEAAKTGAPQYSWTEHNLNQQESLINSTRVLDPANGVYAIPIDEAMSLVVNDLKKQEKDE